MKQWPNCAFLSYLLFGVMTITCTHFCTLLVNFSYRVNHDPSICIHTTSYIHARDLFLRYSKNWFCILWFHMSLVIIWPEYIIDKNKLSVHFSISGKVVFYRLSIDSKFCIHILKLEETINLQTFKFLTCWRKSQSHLFLVSNCFFKRGTLIRGAIIEKEIVKWKRGAIFQNRHG